jgi:hypothetical protein
VRLFADTALLAARMFALAKSWDTGAKSFTGS